MDSLPDGALGIIRLAGRYSPVRMEAAAERALLSGACRCQSVKSILKNALDQQPLGLPAVPRAPPSPHDNIRSAEYFESGAIEMLEQPMIEKLLSMRLQGMVDGLKAQEQDPGARELSFVERLSLLVDQRSNWREAPSQRLYRGYRLTGRAGTGEERHSGTGEGFAVGTESREPFRSRANGCGKKFHRGCSGAEGVPRWILCVLHAGSSAVPRPGAGTR